jgi:hypothetical protein
MAASGPPGLDATEENAKDHKKRPGAAAVHFDQVADLPCCEGEEAGRRECVLQHAGERQHEVVAPGQVGAFVAPESGGIRHHLLLQAAAARPGAGRY